MIHTASLVHDDVLDECGIRRGQPTVNSLFGTRVAVLAGDFLFAQSSWFLANLENLEVIKLISQARTGGPQGLGELCRVGTGGWALKLVHSRLELGKLLARMAAAAADWSSPFLSITWGQLHHNLPAAHFCRPRLRAPAKTPDLALGLRRSSLTLRTARSARLPACLTRPSTCSATWTRASTRRPA